MPNLKHPVIKERKILSPRQSAKPLMQRASYRSGPSLAQPVHAIGNPTLEDWRPFQDARFQPLQERDFPLPSNG